MDPTSLSVATALAKESLPRGLYVSLKKIAPDPILGRFGADLIPYLALLHDLQILVREWNRRYEVLVQEHIKQQDYSGLVEHILEQRKAYRDLRECTHCGSTKTKRLWQWRSRDGLSRRETRLCSRCERRFIRNLPAEIQGFPAPIVLMSQARLLKEAQG